MTVTRVKVLVRVWLTSHYFSCVNKKPFSAVFEALSQALGPIYSKEFRKNEQSHIGIPYFSNHLEGN